MKSQPEENEAEACVEGEDLGLGVGGPREHTRLYKKVADFNEFIDETAKGLTDGELRVWLVLFRFANDGTARASKKTIGERAGRSERQVSRDIASLIRKGGLIEVLDRHDGYKRRGNEYRLGIRPLPRLSRPRRATESASPGAVDPRTDSSSPAGRPDAATEFFSRKPR